MRNDASATSSPHALARLNVKTDVLPVVLFAGIITVCSWIKIPGIVPVTLQTMAVFMAVAVLGTERGSAAVASYIALGLAGAPVFSGYAGGIAYLLGATGGYIIGFLPCAFATGKIIDCFGRKVPVMAAAMIAGLLVCYAFGTAWFMVVANYALKISNMQYVLSVCVTPFIIPDLLKIVAATASGTLTDAVKKVRANKQ